MSKVEKMRPASSKEAQIDDKLDTMAQKLYRSGGDDPTWVEYEELLARRGRLMRPTNFRLKGSILIKTG